MKSLYFSLTLVLLLFSSCDYQGSFTFKIKNETQKEITIKFHYDCLSSGFDNQKEVTILPDEEKIVRVIEAPLNSAAHDCLKDHGLEYFEELPFDTYLEGMKLDKDLWLRENWTYYKKSKWDAEYKMVITNGLLEED
jgi:hypothetical protein